jgi:hypothetical protein
MILDPAAAAKAKAEALAAIMAADGTGLTKDVVIIKEMLDRMQKTLDARGRP